MCLSRSSWKVCPCVCPSVRHSCSPSSAPSTCCLLFLLALGFESVIQTGTTFRNASLLLNFIFIYHCFLGKYLLTLTETRWGFENGAPTVSHRHLGKRKQCFLYLSECLGEHLISLCRLYYSFHLVLDWLLTEASLFLVWILWLNPDLGYLKSILRVAPWNELLLCWLVL